MHSLKKYILTNDLRVVLVPQPQSLTTTVLVLVEAGSKYENKKNSGVSHFLEHLCFKGTKTRQTSIMIASELESLGAIQNAFTSHELTGYHAKVAFDKTQAVLEIIADLYLNPIFEPKEIEKEKGVVIEELNMYEDIPMRRVGDLFAELLYGDQPAGWQVGGTKEVIRSLSKKDILDYRQRHYVAKATTVVVAGNFSSKEIFLKIKDLFKDTSTAKKFSKIKTVDLQSRPNLLLRHKDSDQTHIILGFRAFNMFDKRRFALEILGDILGGGMSSRLFQKVREELGAAYYVRAGSDLFTDHGFFAVSAGLDNKRANQVLKVILGEFKLIRDQRVTPVELQRAKNHLSGTMMIELETSDALAGFYGQQELFHKKIMSPKEVVDKIESVTAGDVLAVAKDIMDNRSLNLAMIGPFKNNAEFKKVLKI